VNPARSLFLALALATASPAAATHPGAGLIHATVTLRDGTTHTGCLRWKDEDAFWDDVFTARQRDLPWFEHADRQALAGERRRQYYATHGLLDRLAWSLHHKGDEVKISRPFICRYGDLAALHLTEDEGKPVIAVLRDGREVAIGVPSRDIGSDLITYPQPDQPVELAWGDVREIRFEAAPATSVPYATRLAGTVEYRGGTLVGYLQWDRSECTSLDMIDSDQQDVALSEVRRIARNRRGGSDVTLADGRVVLLDGTNDVGDGNRGVAVEVAGLGRVTVPWNRFTAADMRLEPATHPGYDEFAPPRPLSGTVTTTDGRTLTGRLVYDLDESATIDILHGTADECDYQIPFASIAAIAPAAPGACDVTLRDGRRLTLGGDEDTGDGHAGLLVFADGQETPAYVLWSAVRQVEFAP
jgi:hypothetical protein